MHFYFFLFILMIFSTPAHAVRMPDCGAITHRDNEVGEVFDYAHKMRFYVNVTDDLNQSCAVLQAVEEYKALTPFIKKDQDLADKVTTDMRDNMLRLKDLIRMYRIWGEVEGQSDVMRLTKLKESRRNIKNVLKALEDQRWILNNLIKT